MVALCPLFLSVPPRKRRLSKKKKLAPLREPLLVKSSFGSLKTQKMNQKKGDLCNGLCHPNQLREVASVPSQAPTMS
uniref:Uncharacterized protein n=1 Tax=Raphanus sativus TaxID=3726 RepID=A0A650GAX4_RAPSA|nr:hypothetical protein [Raphanus sativus]